MEGSTAKNRLSVFDVLYYEDEETDLGVIRAIERFGKFWDIEDSSLDAILIWRMRVRSHALKL